MMLTMGGYVTVPAGLAAWTCKLKLIIHEQNAIPGLANQWLARLSDVVFSGFQNTLSRHKDFRCVGNPLRQSLIESAKKESSSASEAQEVNKSNEHCALKLLVMGGSLEQGF